jgi:hypothetical protein
MPLQGGWSATTLYLILTMAVRREALEPCGELCQPPVEIRPASNSW